MQNLTHDCLKKVLLIDKGVQYFLNVFAFDLLIYLAFFRDVEEGVQLAAYCGTALVVCLIKAIGDVTPLTQFVFLPSAILAVLSFFILAVYYALTFL